jgi:hypothetical protein
MDSLLLSALRDNAKKGELLAKTPEDSDLAAFGSPMPLVSTRIPRSRSD